MRRSCENGHSNWIAQCDSFISDNFFLLLWKYQNQDSRGDITQPFIVPFIPPACRFMTINNPATSITSSPTSIAENVNVTSINVTHSSLFQKVTRWLGYMTKVVERRSTLGWSCERMASAAAVTKSSPRACWEVWQLTAPAAGPVDGHWISRLLAFKELRAVFFHPPPRRPARATFQCQWLCHSHYYTI